MIRFIREPKRKKRNEMIHWSNPKYSKWSTLCWTWAPWFYSPHVAHPCCGYYCSHWKLWFFFLFHQSIRFQTYKRHPVCINKNPRTLWKLIQRISSMLPCRWAKIVLAKWMNYGTSKSGEFVNLTTCRFQNPSQVIVALPHALNVPQSYEIRRPLWENDKRVS